MIAVVAELAADQRFCIKCQTCFLQRAPVFVRDATDLRSEQVDCLD